MSEYVTWKVLDRVGLADEVLELIDQSIWKDLFQMWEDAYAPVVYEVLTTLTVVREPCNLDREIIQFKTFDKEYKMSVN